MAQGFGVRGKGAGVWGKRLGVGGGGLGVQGWGLGVGSERLEDACTHDARSGGREA